MEASTKNRRARRAGLGLAGGAAAVLAVTATAWACTVQDHNLNISPTTGPAGTSVTVSGSCSRNTACPTARVALRQDATPSTGNKNVYDHQVLCDANDPSIGYVDISGGKLSGQGTIAARPAPGPYIVCAGDTLPGPGTVTTQILWDNYTLS